LIPRKNLIDLSEFQEPGQYQPATWEGCVVKISDKIAYIGRDIEDAINLGFLDEETKSKLLEMAREHDEKVLNTTVIMHNLIIDICKNSTPEKGICLSPKFLEQINNIKEFNYNHIYKHERLLPFKEYSDLVINQVFKVLYETFDGENSWKLIEEKREYYPLLMNSFIEWLAKYCEIGILPNDKLQTIALTCENEKIYATLSDKTIYARAVIDFLAGMTDGFAIKVFNELLTY